MRTTVVKRKNRQTGLDALTWSIFLSLISSLLFKRIVDIWGTVAVPDCQELPVAFMGVTSRFDGPMEWLLVIAISAAALLIVQAGHALVSRSAGRTFWLLWSVNMAAAALLIWSFLLSWAYFNPTARSAASIFQFTQTFAPDHGYSTPDPVPRAASESYDDWIWHEDIDAWINESIGLMQREETVRTCEPAELRRGQLKLIYGERDTDGTLIDSIPSETLRKPVESFVLYDLDGNYLVTLGGLYVTRSAITRARDAAYDPEKAAMSPQEAERRYFAWIETQYAPQPAATPDFPRIPKEKIDQIVAESWGDDRPAWHED